jgi:hypothetical protein
LARLKLFVPSTQIKMENAMDRDQFKFDEQTLEHLTRVRASLTGKVEALRICGPMGIVTWQPRMRQHPHAGLLDEELLMLYPKPR